MKQVGILTLGQMADCSKKTGQLSISCSDLQRGPPKYRTMRL